VDRVDTSGDVAVSTVGSGPSGEVGLDRRRINLVFVTVLLGMLLAALDQTIVSTALPTIVGDLGGAGHLSWVVSSFEHRLVDRPGHVRRGRRRVGQRPAPASPASQPSLTPPSRAQRGRVGCS
jgi:hypothetical protein